MGINLGARLRAAPSGPGNRDGAPRHSVATTTAWEIDWITRGVRVFLPQARAKLRDAVPEAPHRLLVYPDPAIHEQTVRDWYDWEMALVALRAIQGPHPRCQQPEFRLAFARLVTHYWRHNGWLEDGVLLREVQRLSGIPAILIHGRLDIGSPLVTAWRPQRGWPGGELVIVETAGHSASDPGMGENIVAATNRFASGR